MTVEDLKAEYEQASKEQSTLAAEYEAKLQKVFAKWASLKAEYHGPIEEANTNAAQAQKAYLDALTLAELVERGDEGHEIALNIAATGGYTQDQVTEAFG